MSKSNQLSKELFLLFFVALGCSSHGPVEGVWRPGPGEDPQRIPGPMKNFGPHDSYPDALKAACPMILSKPNATVGHLHRADPQLALRTATEYCAWLYYTPEHKYEMSMLTDLSMPDDLVTGKRSCVLPAFVDDPRYKSSDIKYVLALHNHPFGSELSPQDLRFIDEMASLHDWSIQTKDRGEILLSIIAFFSKSRSSDVPSCDGFYQYIPAARAMLLWTQAQGQWKMEMLGRVTRNSEQAYHIEKN